MDDTIRMNCKIYRFLRYFSIGTLVVAVLATLSPDDAWAKVYRCNGMIRFTPCPAYQSTMRAQLRTSSIKMAPKGIIPANAYARIVDQSYVQLTGRDGLWKGRVAGNGMVHLELQILKNGAIESRRYMGKVYLVNKDTAFRFRSTIPTIDRWDWRVIAYNGPSPA